MSSPTSSLKKTKRTPLPAIKSPDSRKLTIPYRQPISGSLHSPKGHDTMASPDALERELRKSFHGHQQPCSPSDGEFIASMARRLSVLEQQLLAKCKEIVEKDEKINVLEDRLAVLEASRSSGAGSLDLPLTELQQKCLVLQKRQQEMERFLADYGMIWVGDDSGDENHEDDAYQDENFGDGMWRPDTSVCHDMFTVHFNKIVTNLKELNVLAGEDEARISHTVTGAKLKFLDPIPLTVYQNGFLLFSGPFRPYSDPLSQRFIQDIMDGYFPSELQDRYPDGVPITLTDKREVIFRDRRHETAFPGSGEVLGGEAGPSHLITTGQLRTEGKKTNGIKETNEPPGGIVPVDNFLDRLPRSIVKNGKVIDIRSDISQQLKHRPGSGVVSVVDTPAVQAIRDGRLSDKDITTLRVKSEGGDKTYIVKLKFSDTIQTLRQYIDSQRSGNVKPYCIRTSFPNKVYNKEEDTLEQCGLTPNATLHLSLL